jgi:nicotinamidase-related amidase
MPSTPPSSTCNCAGAASRRWCSAAWELGYQLVIAEDACSAPLAEPHRASMQYVMPRLGHVRSTAQLLATPPETPTDTV